MPILQPGTRYFNHRRQIGLLRTDSYCFHELRPIHLHYKNNNLKKTNNNNNDPLKHMLASRRVPHRIQDWGASVGICGTSPRDSRVQKAMNALSESITAVFSCVTDIISLILLNCFGISSVNEHNGIVGGKAMQTARQLQLLLGSASPLEKRRAHQW